MSRMSANVALKIRKLRKSLNENQAEFGERFGVEQATVSRWEAGKPVGRKYQELIAGLASTTVAEFFHSDVEPRVIPVVGDMSGGEAFSPVDDYEQGAASEYVKIDFSDEDPVAIRVRGNSMAPVYRDGDLIICSRLRGADIASALNKDCAVKTAAGEGYVKRLMTGTTSGVFRLRSYNSTYDDLVDVELDWAAPVRWVQRR